MTVTPEVSLNDLDTFIVERPEVMQHQYELKHLYEDRFSYSSNIDKVHSHFRNRFVNQQRNTYG